MEDISQGIFGPAIIISPVTNIELIIALLSSSALCLVIAKVYITTHLGYSYSKSFLQTIVLVGVTVSLIMVVIGSDIARAFALVGAMSIVRFRTPVKDARDLVFVFAAIAVGMACGVQFHTFAGIFTAFLAALILGFHYFRFGELPHRGFVVKMRVHGGDKVRISQLCTELCRRHAIVSVTRVGDGELEEVIYEVELKRGIDYKDLIERLTQAVNPMSINVLVGEGNVNV